MNKILIAADSCCDMTDELREILGVVTVPMTINAGGKELTDDGTIDTEELLEIIMSGKKVLSSFPSPDVYAKIYRNNDIKFCVTISKELSGAHSSAVLGTELAKRNDISVIDSKSASAAEILTVMHLRKLINKGSGREEILSSLKEKIDGMNTFISLERLDMLKANGRLEKIASAAVPALGIRPMLSAEEGKIKFNGFARGKKHSLNRMLHLVEKSGKETKGKAAVITHSYADDMALELKHELVKRYHFEEILICRTNGISTMYAQKGGIVLAF